MAGGGDIDVAVLHLEHAGRDGGRMIVAGLLGHLVRLQPARGLEVEHEDLRLQQRGGDPLPLAGALALEQRDHDADRAEQAGAEIGDRDAGAHRALPGQAGDRHQPAHALRDLVDARPVAIGAVLAEAGNAGEDDAFVDLAQFVVVDAEPVFHVGAEILHHHIGLRDHAQEGGVPLRRLEVEGHAALVAMQVLEIRSLARPARRLAFLQTRPASRP